MLSVFTATTVLQVQVKLELMFSPDLLNHETPLYQQLYQRLSENVSF